MLLSKYPIIIDPFEHVGKSIWRNGCYENQTVELIHHLITPGMVIVDAGAHIGQYTILCSKLATDTGRVHAFEPDPATFVQLLENLQLNGTENTVANNIALSNYVGTTSLFLSPITNIGGNSLRVQENHDGHSIDVMLTTLDEYTSKVGLNRLDLLKADVEGAELLFLEGGRNVITSYRSLMILEFSIHFAAFGYRSEDLCNKLKRWDYLIYRIESMPLHRYQPRSEEPKDFNVLCIHKSRLHQLEQRRILKNNEE